MNEHERIIRKVQGLIMPLMLIASLALSACGGIISDSRPDAPNPELEATHRTALFQRFCGLFLNKIETIPGTGTTLEHHILSYSVGDDLVMQFADDGEQIPTDECGEITFIGPAPYMDEFNNLQVGGAGFFVPQQVTGTN